jgi:hypothetical protein
MNALEPAPVPELSDEWIASHCSVLVETIDAHHRRPVRWIALAGATAATATAASTLLLVAGNTPVAFAGWSATPTAPATGQLAAATTSCLSSLAGMGPTNKADDAATLVPELNDVRGPYTLTVYGTSGQEDQLMCVAEPGGNTAVRWLSPSSAAVAPSAIAVDQVSFGTLEGQTYTLVMGRTGMGVTGVALTLGDGSTVTATSGNGLFLAWWPGTQSITSAAVTSAVGTSTQPLDLPAPNGAPGLKTSPTAPGTAPSGIASTNGNTVCHVHSC